jgi:3-oxoacyl-[acyl-carrier protein] reductase
MTEYVPTYPDLAGKVAVVTGGSGGIGAAACRLLAANGAKVAVNGRDETKIDAVVGEIHSDGGQAIGVVADVTAFAAVEEMRQRVEEELGPVDVLAAFAGGQGYPTPTAQMAEEQWRSVIDSNLTATFLTVRSILPGMVERGQGSIVTMASSAGRLPSQASAAYAAAKAGVVMFSKHVASEVGQHGVRVNCLAPSSVLTERVKRLMPEETQQQVAAMHPLGRMGTPDDVALATLFLASESSSWITGVTLDVAGGRIIV